MLTDAQLLELIEQTPAEELSPEQLEALRARIHQSPELLAALQERLLMDQYLGDALGGMNVAVEAIFAAAEPGPRRNWVYWVLGLATVLVPLAVWIFSSSPEEEDPDKPGITVVRRDDPQPEDPVKPPNDPGSEAADPKSNDPKPDEPEKPEDPSELGTANDSDPMPIEPMPIEPLPAVGELRLPPAGHPDLELWNVLAEPVPFAEAKFADFALERSTMGVEDLRKWLRPINGKLREVSQGPPLSEGTHALTSAWYPDMALRLSLLNHNGLRIHVFHGQQGASFELYSQPRLQWASYLARRDGDESSPRHLALVGTDGGRYQRSGAGTVEMRYVDGRLLLSRGDVNLLAVPLPGPPEDVFFEGLIFWQGITAVRSEPPQLETPHRPVVLRSRHPGRMAFRSTLPRGSQLNSLADGRLELTASDIKSRAAATLPIGEPGLYEVILAVDGPQPGTGVFLADRAGRVLHRVAFAEDSKTGWTTYLATQDERTVKVTEDPTKRPAQFAAQRQWLRLVVGSGTCKYYVSADGQFWRSSGERPWQNVDTGGVAALGIYCAPGDDERSITLAHAEVREFVSIDHLIPMDLRNRALVLDNADDWSEWLEVVERRRPDEIPLDAWREACAVRTLWGSPPVELSRELLHLLGEAALARAETTGDYVALLGELAELSDTYSDARAKEFVQLYFRRLAEQQLNGGLPDYRQVEHALMAAPIDASINLDAVPAPLVRAELVDYIYRNQWNEAREASTRHRYWYAPQARLGRQTPVLELIDWADALSARRNPLDDSDAPNLPGDWRHPALVRISKEGYNVMAEFEAALANQSFEDACAIISHANAAAALGLLPDSVERRLLVSLPAAIQQAMQDWPKLKQTMNDKFGPLGRLRIRTAVDAGDSEAVQAATLQFAATEAAAQAHYWLGNRALSSGNFAQAIGHFQRALPDIAADQRPQVSARLRLAAAMVGREVGDAVQVPVEFGGTELSAKEFEQLVQETMRARRGSSPANLQHQNEVDTVLPLGTYKAEGWAKFAGTKGTDPNQAPRGLDWPARQTAVTIAQGQMLVSDRFRVSSYRLSDQALMWDVQVPDKPRVHHWPQALMRPLMTQQGIVVRRMLKSGPVLTCLAPNDGKTLWQTDPAIAVASDPVWVNHGLYTMTIQARHDRSRQLSLSAYDPETGEAISHRPLILLRDLNDGQYPCNIAAVDNLIYGTVAGSVFCCDVLGQPQWLRRQSWFPEDLDSQWDYQVRTDPLVEQGRVFVTQPGVKAVECLDAHTGRSMWCTTVMDLCRLLGRVADVVLIETESGIRGLDADSGEFRWHFAEKQLLHAQQVGKQRLLVTRRVDQADGKQAVQFVWLDPSDGQVVAQSQLESPTAIADAKLPMCGPFFAEGNRTWALLGSGDTEAERLIVELKRTGTIGPQSARRP